MAGDFKITVKGLRQLKGKLSAKAMGDAIYKGLDRWGIYLQGELGTYPPKETKTRKEAFGQTFFSDKQRRGFFAKLRSGEIRFRGSETDPGLWRVFGPWIRGGNLGPFKEVSP